MLHFSKQSTSSWNFFYTQISLILKFLPLNCQLESRLYVLVYFCTHTSDVTLFFIEYNPCAANVQKCFNFQAQEDRIKEQEIGKAERARLEEILNMCAEYEKQAQCEKHNKPTPNR